MTKKEKEVTQIELRDALNELTERIETEYEQDLNDLGFSSRIFYLDFKTDDYMRVEAKMNISSGLMDAEAALKIAEITFRLAWAIKEFKFNGYKLVFR